MSLKENLAKLNEDQYKAATNYEGSYFIMAGPGSGKTATMVQRVAYMIDQGVDPKSIILFTFTNKAANELKERAINIVGNKAKLITVGTYHSVCARMLRKYAGVLGHYDNNFTIYDTDDSLAILKPHCKKEVLDPKEVLSDISAFKNNMITPTEAYNQANNGFARRKAIAYSFYQESLQKQNAMDFDDLIWNMIKAIEINPIVQQDLNDRYKYILSDESHDSNLRDLRLIKLLAGRDENVCFILDPNQSIYKFRGADIDAVMDVRRQYRNLTTFHLKTNYRSSETIVNASESLIQHNPQEKGRKIKAHNDGGDKLVYLEADNQDQEAVRIVSIIKALEKSGESLNDIAILLRMNYLSRPIEKALTLSGIPFEMKSSVGFFDRAEIKDIMAYVRLINNPYDYIAFKRIVNLPKRGIGKKNLEAIVDTVNDSPERISFLDAMKDMTFKGKAKTGSEDFIKLMDRLSTIESEYEETGGALAAIISEIGYMAYLRKEEKEIDVLEDRLANIEELINFSFNFVNLQELVQSASLFGSDEEEVKGAEEEPEVEAKPSVKILTLHGSKGLEWPNVILPNSNEGVLPHKRAIADENVDEERRLYYVGMTRAEKRLFLTRSKTTFTMGKFSFEKPSRFIKEIDPSFLIKAE